MIELEQVKKVYNRCNTMKDLEWLEDAFSKIEKTTLSMLTEDDMMVLALIRDNIPRVEGRILIIGAEYHHLAGYLRLFFPEQKVETWPSLKMVYEFCCENATVVLTDNWADLHLISGSLMDRGALLWCLFKMDETEKVWNTLVYEGFIPENRAYMLKSEQGENTVYLLKSNYLPVAFERNVKAIYNKIYVLCPAGVKSGGPELLHQLVFHLTRLGADAYIVYISESDTERIKQCHPDFIKYVSGRVCKQENIEFSTGNAMVIPEAWPVFLKYAGNTEKIFWWLSVDNFINVYGKDDPMLPEYEKEVTYLADYMLYQSEYARRYALSIGADEGRLRHLGDYLNREYIDNSKEFLRLPKEKIVAYNPKKGKDFTEALINEGKDIVWVPIEKMTTRQVRELLCRAMVYIDFGEHPGKDRIPREAAMCGCCIITGRKGAAAFNEDVDIPERYRLDEKCVSIQEILELIRELLDDYRIRISDYGTYRDRILNEYNEFIRDLKEIFFIHE